MCVQVHFRHLYGLLPLFLLLSFPSKRTRSGDQNDTTGIFIGRLTLPNSNFPISFITKLGR